MDKLCGVLASQAGALPDRHVNRNIGPVILIGQTMREFDRRCLTRIEPLTAAEIRAIRETSGVSQAVFARYLNVTVSLVSQWERGEKSPSGASLKLLSLVKHKGLEVIA